MRSFRGRVAMIHANGNGFCHRSSTFPFSFCLFISFCGARRSRYGATVLWRTAALVPGCFSRGDQLHGGCFQRFVPFLRQLPVTDLYPDCYTWQYGEAEPPVSWDIFELFAHVPSLLIFSAGYSRIAVSISDANLICASSDTVKIVAAPARLSILHDA